MSPLAYNISLHVFDVGNQCFIVLPPAACTSTEPLSLMFFSSLPCSLHFQHTPISCLMLPTLEASGGNRRTTLESCMPSPLPFSSIISLAERSPTLLCARICQHCHGDSCRTDRAGAVFDIERFVCCGIRVDAKVRDCLAESHRRFLNVHRVGMLSAETPHC